MITRLLFLFLLLTATAAAQPRWEFVEAWGSYVSGIFPMPDGTLLTSTGGGFYSSSNRGKEWSLIAKNPHYALVGFNPITGTLIGWGIKRMIYSTDYGRSWEKATVDSARAEHLYYITLAGDGTFYAATYYPNRGHGGVFRSTDDGRSWSCIGIPGRGFDALLLTKHGALIAAANDAGAGEKELYVSTDGGNTWSEARPVPWAKGDRYLHEHLTDLVIDSVGALYAVTPIGMWKSTDLGVTWREIVRDTVNLFWSLRIAPDGRLDITGRGGVRHSSDGGTSWSDGSPRIPYPDGEVMAIGPVDLFLRPGDGAGILYSGDSGKSWERRNHGIPATIYWMHAAGGRIIVNAHGEHRTSADGGATWQLLPSQKKYAAFQRGGGVGRGISDAGTLLVADDSTLHRSTDGGATWTRTEWNILFRGFAGNGAGDLFGLAWHNHHPHLLISYDDGFNWQPHAQNDLIRSIGGIVFDGRRAGYAATENGIVITRDNGRTWSMGYQSPAYALTVDKGGCAIAMTDSGVVRSDDHGKSWKVVADTTLHFARLATAPDGSIIGYRVVRGIDTSIMDGLPYSSIEGYEIWRSVDRGATWKPFTKGLTNDRIISFTADRSTGAVYVATEGGGLFRMVGTERTGRGALPDALR